MLIYLHDHHSTHYSTCHSTCSSLYSSFYMLITLLVILHARYSTRHSTCSSLYSSFYILVYLHVQLPNFSSNALLNFLPNFLSNALSNTLPNFLHASNYERITRVKQCFKQCFLHSLKTVLLLSWLVIFALSRRSTLGNSEDSEFLLLLTSFFHSFYFLFRTK